MLMKFDEFRLPGRKAFQPSNIWIEVVMIDVTGQLIEHLPKEHRNIATDFGNGSKHDFTLFKDSRSIMSAYFASSDYQIILGWHSNSQKPAKKSSLHLLTKSKRREIANYQEGTFLLKF